MPNFYYTSKCKKCILFKEDGTQLYHCNHEGNNSKNKYLRILFEWPPNIALKCVYFKKDINKKDIKDTITLCGSTRLLDKFQETNSRLTAMGYTVLTIDIVFDKNKLIAEPDIKEMLENEHNILWLEIVENSGLVITIPELTKALAVNSAVEILSGIGQKTDDKDKKKLIEHLIDEFKLAVNEEPLLQNGLAN